MNSILVGNGLIIQYGGKEYVNKEINLRTKRFIKNGHSDDMIKDITPKEAHYVHLMIQKEMLEMIEGKYDIYIQTEKEKNALNDFKKRYTKRIDPDSIGFEDYFLLCRLLANKDGCDEKSKQGRADAMRRYFLDAIYNDGKINEIYTKFPKKINPFFDQYDEIFTTNYDKNIEKTIEKNVNHLHGQFDILGALQNPESFRNKLENRPCENYTFTQKNAHMHCNALMDFAKDYYKNEIATNDMLNYWVEQYRTSKDIKNEIDNWKNEPDLRTQNLFKAIKLLVEEQRSGFEEYPFRKLENINGNLTILGLSPTNDSHILDIIVRNEKIDEVSYYYFNIEEGKQIKKILKNKKTKCENVRELWENLEKD